MMERFLQRKQRSPHNGGAGSARHTPGEPDRAAEIKAIMRKHGIDEKPVEYNKPQLQVALDELGISDGQIQKIIILDVLRAQTHGSRNVEPKKEDILEIGKKTLETWISTEDVLKSSNLKERDHAIANLGDLTLRGLVSYRGVLERFEALSTSDPELKIAIKAVLREMAELAKNNKAADLEKEARALLERLG